MRELFIGLMSGTSMDGIDVALVDLANNAFLANKTYPYSDAIKGKLFEIVNEEKQDLKSYSQLNTLLGREFAWAINRLLQEAHCSFREIIAVGSHGQTICHDAFADIPFTIQLGCPHTIAELTGIQVVADFRTRDLVVGGQGAPLAPLAHQALFKDQEYPLAVVNIGGIANISYLENKDHVLGFDIGPGNCLLDAWIKNHLGKDYDEQGTWASQGRVIEPLLSALLTDPYFTRGFPKSIGKEYFSLEWLKKALLPTHAAVDVQATLLMLTVTTIAHEVKRFGGNLRQLLLCGGGVHNKLLMEELEKSLPSLQVKSTNAIDVNADFIEAFLFAWLARETLAYRPLPLQGITGAKKSVILGTIYPKIIDK